MAVTVPTFDIAGATSAWDTAVRGAGAAQLFAANKTDPNGDVQVTSINTVAGAVHGNGVDTALDQINEVFNGTRAITALGIGSAVSAVSDTNSDDLVVGSTSASSCGMTILAQDNAWLNMSDNGGLVGGLRYTQASDRLSFYTAGVQRAFISSAEFTPQSNGTIDIGRASLQWQDIFLSGNANVGGQVNLPSYTVAGVPSAATAGGLIYVSDETGGATLAFADGTNWRRAQDRAIVS